MSVLPSAYPPQEREYYLRVLLALDRFRHHVIDVLDHLPAEEREALRARFAEWRARCVPDRRDGPGEAP